MHITGLLKCSLTILPFFMIKKLLSFLNQPYPDDDDIWSVIKGAISGGFVVFLVLVLLQPFGLNAVGSNAWMYCAAFGGISTLIALIFDFTSIYLLGLKRDHPTWTLWKWIVMILVLILLIASANFVFISYSIVGSFDLSQFGYVLYSTVVIGIFPTLIFGALRTIKNLKANQKIATEIAPYKEISKSTLIKLPIHNSKSTFEVDVHKILYVEAMQNYVNIIYRDEEGMQKELVRNTLSAIEQALLTTNIIRSHRSYLVNSEKIAKVNGNAQGLQLHLKDLHDIVIPVSRKYIPKFRG